MRQMQRRHYSRFAEDVVFTLHVMQPTSNAEQGLIARKELFRPRDIYKADRVQKLHAIWLLLQLATSA